MRCLYQGVVLYKLEGVGGLDKEVSPKYFYCFSSSVLE